MQSMFGGASAKRFGREESGALLVFFAVCSAAIFLIAALSFDLGRRAATQTEMQSFADNVALAAAGELDGRPGAIERAERAADELISDTVTFGSGDRTLAGDQDYTISFYESLPDDEGSWDIPLDTGLPENDLIARYARVEVDDIQVEWAFAQLLSVFGSAPPSDQVAAEATAGHTENACGITPIFICVPPAQAVDTDGVWDPANHIGETLRLRPGGGSAGWDPGNFGFINANARMDPAGDCASLFGSSRYRCLIAVGSRNTTCFENGSLSLFNGYLSRLRQTLNTKFDKYDSGFGFFYESDFTYRPGPIVTKSYVEDTTCAFDFAQSSDEATGFLPDDCFNGGGGGCLSYSSDVRVGDGDWSEARMTYVDTNYSVDVATIGTVLPAERITVGGEEYHIDDPFRPGDGTNPRKTEYSSYPEVTAGATRWNYYNAEVAASYFDNPSAAYQSGEVDISGISSAPRATPIDLLEVLDGAGNPVPRDSTSLPHCAPDYELNPRRRTMTVAFLDCTTQLSGGASAQALWFAEVFMLDTATGSSWNPRLNVEIISPGLQNSTPAITEGVFVRQVQLNR